MISLDNINICFSKTIIENSHITIPSGKITAITGASGSGKTSVLYLLGLISSNKKYNYIYEGSVINLKDEMYISQLRREKFGFLFQDNSLIDNLTIADNIRFSANLAGHEISQNEIQELLEYVDLLIDPQTVYPKQLSGGELQRAALAGVIAKKPAYIFADEPTSALDKINTKKIIDIFKKLSKEGITIVIATHSDVLCAEADVVYHIENKKILLEKTDKSDVICQKNHFIDEKGMEYKFGFKDLLQYVNHSTKKGKVLKWIITVFCAIAITGFTLTSSILNYLEQTQKDLLNQLSDREIFLVNQLSSGDEIRDCDGNLVITEDAYSKMCNIDGIQEIYPYFEFRSFSLIPEYRTLGTTVQVQTDHDIRNYYFNIDSQSIPYFIVVPYNHNQKLEQQLKKTYANNDSCGIYLSNQMAENLGLMDENTDVVKLSFDIGIPVKKFESIFEENDNQRYVEDLDIVEFRNMNISISGILNENVVNRYSVNGNNVIYVPYEDLYEVLQQTIKECRDNEYSAIAETFLMKTWQPSAYLVYAESYRNIDSIQRKIENISESFVTRYDFQDTVAMDGMIDAIRTTTNVILGIVMTIIFVLMASVFISTTFNRRREIALLKANGMTNKNLILLMLIEAVTQGTRITIIAVIVSAVLSLIGGMLLLASFAIFTINTVLYIAFMALLFVLIPTIVSVAITVRVEPDKILRN